MLNLLDKKQENKSLKQKKLKISDIEKYYLSNQNNSLIGLEYERLSLDKNTFKNASYELLEKIIKHFCEITSWNLIYDDKTIIGAKSDSGSSISLEPGCQLEISLSPKKEILFIDYEANKIINLLDKIASAYDVIFLGYGISPVTCVDDITLLNKRRYQLMNKFLPKRHYGELSQRMMRQSAGIQINIDYKDKKDAYLKLKFFNLISPFMMGLCANSPFENNILTDKYSNRAHIWRYTGKERCNFFYKKIFSSPFRVRNIFKNYINAILDVPMIFIERDNKLIPLEGKITFRDFMNSGYLDYQATMDDYITHSSLCFPDVRLKNYIEIRNHDSQDIKIARALFPGARCSLDALCKRFEIDNSSRTLHGALLDAQLLAEVYLELLGGKEPSLLLDGKKENLKNNEKDIIRNFRKARDFSLSDEEINLHNDFLAQKIKGAIWNS